MTAPAGDVLAAFDCTTPAAALAGGQGRSWRSGDVVLKPAEENPEITDWICELLVTLEPVGYRISRPLRASDGDWRYGGWTASVYEPGTAAHVTGGPWSDVLRAGAAFARDLTCVPKPWFTPLRTDRWGIADRVAWQEESIDLPAEYAELVTRLTALAGDRPTGSPQVLHGDLTGNVLLHPGADPLILDFSPYWRPAPYALAVVLTDAASWYGADPRLFRQHADEFGAEAVGYLARSLMFRVVTSGLWVVERRLPNDDLRSFERVADQLSALAGSG